MNIKLLFVFFFGYCVSYCTTIMRESRIIGGHPAPLGKFPHQVAIYNDEEYVCGGSLIDPQYIVTAAHCVVKPYTGEPEPVNKIIVKIGDVNISSISMTSYHTSKIYIKQPYHMMINSTARNDIAVLKLQIPVQLKPNIIDTIELATFDPPVGSKCFVSGWGVLHEDNTSPTPENLYYTELPIIDRTICVNFYKTKKVPINNDMLCTEYSEGMKDFCHGDSGGPLTCDNKLAGIISFSRSCAKPNIPSVYVSIAKKIPWIVAVLLDNLDETPPLKWKEMVFKNG